MLIDRVLIYKRPYGHSGTGTPFPMSMVISDGWIPFFGFTIWKNRQQAGFERENKIDNALPKPTTTRYTDHKNKSIRKRNNLGCSPRLWKDKQKFERGTLTWEHDNAMEKITFSLTPSTTTHIYFCSCFSFSSSKDFLSCKFKISTYSVLLCFFKMELFMTKPRKTTARKKICLTTSVLICFFFSFSLKCHSYNQRGR